MGLIGRRLIPRWRILRRRRGRIFVSLKQGRKVRNLFRCSRRNQIHHAHDRFRHVIAWRVPAVPGRCLRFRLGQQFCEGRASRMSRQRSTCHDAKRQDAKPVRTGPSAASDPDYGSFHCAFHSCARVETIRAQSEQSHPRRFETDRRRAARAVCGGERSAEASFNSVRA
jgi:hypothetical protein